MFSRDEMQRAIEDALKTMEGVALELYRRGREEAREELEEARARNADMRAMLEQVTRERDEARTSCPDCAMYAERSARFAEQADRLQRERDEARAEVDGMRSQIERLRGVLHSVSLDEYESTSSAAEKVHAHARQARVVLNETLADVTPSDAAHVASLENLFLKACNRAQKWETASKDAYRRGAEAMREACQQWCRAWENDGEAIADALADLQVEDKP